jgi:hypothetical protein
MVLIRQVRERIKCSESAKNTKDGVIIRNRFKRIIQFLILLNKYWMPIKMTFRYQFDAKKKKATSFTLLFVVLVCFRVDEPSFNNSINHITQFIIIILLF